MATPKRIGFRGDSCVNSRLWQGVEMHKTPSIRRSCNTATNKKRRIGYRKSLLVTGIIAAVLAISNTVVTAAAPRDYISIVGSSTVYSFATVVAETFGKTSNLKTPKIESTSSGGGLKLFCSGVAEEHTDIAGASWRIKASEKVIRMNTEIEE